MLAAAGELLVLAARKMFGDGMLRLGPDVVWMTPLAVGLLCSTAAVPFYLKRKAFGQPVVATRPAVFAVALVGAAGVFLGIPRLYPSALLFLSMAVAWRISRGLSLESARVSRLVRRSSNWLLGGFTVLGLLVGGGGRWYAERIPSSMPEPSRDAPNVLLIIWDTVRAASLGLYGYERATTPNLEDLAARGTVFNRAIATTSWTLPSHVGMFTGLFASELWADFRMPFVAPVPTLAEELRNRGYVTAGFVGNTFYVGRESGLARGFMHFDDYPLSLSEFVLSTTLGRVLITNNRFRRRIGSTDIFARRSAGDLTDRLVNWFDRPRSRPFFAFINLFDAHEPYRPPPAFAERFGTARPRRLANLDHSQLRNATRWSRRSMPADEQQAEQDAYDAAILYLDHELGRLLEELDRRDLRENTIIIVTSDHGESFGEHALWGHGSTVYTTQVHVPLVIAGSGRVPAARRIDRPVSMRSVAATVLDLTQPGSANPFPGVSFARAWSRFADDSTVQDTVLAEFEQDNLRSVVVGRWHYIWRGSEAVELYDLDTDPFEFRNLASTDSVRSLIDSVHATYRSHLERPWK